MELSGDLSAEALESLLPDRPLQYYPTLLSTGVSAIAWANSGAPDGAVVVADYQVSPRGRADRPWKLTPGRGLGFSLVMHPELPAAREGWLYTVVLTALADVYGDGATIEWPDEVHVDGEVAAAVGIRARLGAQGIKWAVIDLLMPNAEPPRGELLGNVLKAIDARRAGAESEILEDYGRRCETMGRSLRMRLLGGTGPKMEGTAVRTLEDGAIVLETPQGAETPVRPQDIRDVVQA
jgi:BirA family transcriptional regulator, biotin operon repressor / biotin---[acetyl-CoA-carboxylase] ligase